MRKSIVFLYSRLSGYLLSCLKALTQEGVAIHLITRPASKDAPFELSFEGDITVYDRTDFKNKENLLAKISDINPSIICASGWMDKDYLYVCRKYKNKIPTVMGMDNHWLGSPKQYLAILLSPFVLQTSFSHIWIPGEIQRVYARKLGFKSDFTLLGLYSADTELFSSINNHSKEIQHRFLYIGRYVEQKGLCTLFDAFIQLQQENPNDWELWCIGDGPLRTAVPDHPKIRHLGFKQPTELPNLIIQTGVFVLPSLHEPWGVVVQEMAAAGMPLIISKNVGAAEKYVSPPTNGYLFKPGDTNDLKQKFSLMINSSSRSLSNMAAESYRLGNQWSPTLWSRQLTMLL